MTDYTALAVERLQNERDAALGAARYLAGRLHYVGDCRLCPLSRESTADLWCDGSMLSSPHHWRDCTTAVVHKLVCGNLEDK